MLNYLTHEVDDFLIITCEDFPEGTDEQRKPTREHLYSTIQNRPDPRFAVDLGAIEYLSSADIGVLITIKRRVDARNGRLVLFQVQPFVVDILRTMKLLGLFTLAEDWAEAQARLRA